MILSDFYKIPVEVSLLLIGSAIFVSAVASLVVKKKVDG